MRDRRMLLEILELLPRLATEIIRQESGNVRGAREAPQIGHARTHDRRLESLRLRDGPRGHEPAVAPAHYGEPIRIRDAHRDYMVQTGLIVLEIASAPIVVIREAKFLSI